MRTVPQEDCESDAHHFDPGPEADIFFQTIDAIRR